MNSSPGDLRQLTGKRAWYTTQLSRVPSWNETEIIGLLSTSLASAGFQTQLTDQTLAWGYELTIIRNSVEAMLAANPSCGDWVVALEYEIPRRSKRIDMVLVTPHAVISTEFKIDANSYLRSDLWQAQDYASELRDFHEGSLKIPIESVLVATRAATIAIDEAKDGKSNVWRSNASTLASVLISLANSHASSLVANADPETWLNAGYRPTPSIVEAARRLFAGHNIRELSHSYADNLTGTTNAIADVIGSARSNNRRVICFVTGVPGSGKTLAGLTAMQDVRALQLDPGTAAFMSGNGPLVRVLRDALVRDEAKRGGKVKEAKRQTRLLIQIVHQFIEEYGVRHIDKAPPEHVIAFDEAQRAWHAAKLSKRHKGLGRSEPDLILEIMSRPDSWSVVVALVGGGQEIHDGEAGLGEWGRALQKAAFPWEVVVSQEALAGGSSVAGHRLFVEPTAIAGRIQTEPAMHLSVSVRSPKAQRLAEWVNAVVELDSSAACQALTSVQGFRIVITRSLSQARAWLRRYATGTLRAGLLASSGALRLRPDGLEIDSDFHRGFPIERWFLDGRDDFRSSQSLEVAMTEFECQGLELDYVGLCWGNDLTVADDQSSWTLCRLSGKNWQLIRNSVKRQYLLNKYRVLMTRAREGIVIWVPQGDRLDRTRQPEPFDRTAAFLRAAGVAEIDDTDL
jgi:hypothetical protein